MTSLFGSTALISGLLAIAGGLYLLQRLRVRHRPVRVVSTLFWRAAVEEARARVLVERFRHPLVYLFLLAICALLWFAAGGLGFEDRSGTHHVVLIDGSQGMGGGDRFGATIARVEAALAELPRARRQVLLVGGEVRTLLAPGEPDRLFTVRSEGATAERAPSSIEGTILSLLPYLSSGEETTLWIASDTAISPELRAELPAEVTVASLRAPGDPPVGNRAIVACGVSPAASGNWELVDLLVEVAGSDPGGMSLTASLGGAGIAGGTTRSDSAGRAQFLFSDLPALGARFEARLSGSDPNPLDDEVARVLPVRRIVSVVLDPDLRPWLEPVLAADPALRVVESGGDVVVRRSQSGLGAGLPALEFVTRESQEESILLSHSGEESSAEVLESALLGLGLDQVDAMELAEAAGRPITLGARPADRRAIGVWEDLLAQEYNFVSSRSFPLFVALSIRWILAVEDFPAEIAAGRNWVDPSGADARLRDGDRMLDPVGAPLRPPRAGDYLDLRGNPVAVASLAPAGAEAGGAESGAAIIADDVDSPGGTQPLANLLALVVLAMLGAEWFFHRRGEVP